jgi:hypothetical protein
MMITQVLIALTVIMMLTIPLGAEHLPMGRGGSDQAAD